MYSVLSLRDISGWEKNIIGNGVVLDPVLFRQEAESLAASGHDLTKQLCISKKAHLILPTHRVLDAAYEAAKGDAKIGTTGKGIGPTYTDKVSRNGLRVGDVLYHFEDKYAAAKKKHEAILKALNYRYDITELEKEWFEAIAYLEAFQLIDSEHVINNLLEEGKSVLAEGTRNDAGCGFRLLSFCDFVEYYLCRSLYRFGSRSGKYR